MTMSNQCQIENYRIDFDQTPNKHTNLAIIDALNLQHTMVRMISETASRTLAENKRGRSSSPNGVSMRFVLSLTGVRKCILPFLQPS